MDIKKGKLHKLTNWIWQLFKMSPNLSALSIPGVLGIKKRAVGSLFLMGREIVGDKPVAPLLRQELDGEMSLDLQYIISTPPLRQCGASGIHPVHSTKSLVKVFYRRVGYQKQIMAMHDSRDLPFYPEFLRHLCHPPR